MTTSLSPGRFRTLAPVLFAAALAACGCAPSPTQFGLNEVYIRNQERAVREEMTSQRRQDIEQLLGLLFGEPDRPRLPSAAESTMGEILDEHLLDLAAGPVRSAQDGTSYGLYRKHCVRCHGLSGDGAGPAAAFMDPYPRDFRRGVFKFKSTPLGRKPTDDDLKRVLVRGVPGTAMPSYRLLDDRELDALVHYVKYLSIRGEVERELIFESVNEFDPDDRIAGESSEGVAWSDVPDEPRELLEAIVADVSEKWRDAPQQVTRVPPRSEEVRLADGADRGRELFYGEVANCAKCHGELAEGDGQTTDYDDWTQEIDPTNPRVVRLYLAAGALPPRTVNPRNLRLGVYSGGGEPDDLYRRLKNGIEGTPMPGVLWKPDDAPENQEGLTTREIWRLVDYVRALPQEPERPPPSSLAQDAADRSQTEPTSASSSSSGRAPGEESGTAWRIGVSE